MMAVGRSGGGAAQGRVDHDAVFRGQLGRHGAAAVPPPLTYFRPVNSVGGDTRGVGGHGQFAIDFREDG